MRFVERLHNWGDIASIENFVLSAIELEKIKEALIRALDFPKRDRSISTDGELWGLESALFQYTAVAFSNPTSNTEARGLESFVSLREILEESAK